MIFLYFVPGESMSPTSLQLKWLMSPLFNITTLLGTVVVYSYSSLLAIIIMT